MSRYSVYVYTKLLTTCSFSGLIPPGVVERTLNNLFSYWFSSSQDTSPGAGKLIHVS